MARRKKKKPVNYKLVLKYALLYPECNPDLNIGVYQLMHKIETNHYKGNRNPSSDATIIKIKKLFKDTDILKQIKLQRILLGINHGK